MPQISVRGVEMPESPIRKLAPLAYAAKDRGIHVYHLNIGQPDLPTPKAAIDAIKNIDRTILEYSPSQGYLSYRKKLVGYYSKYNINLTPDDIIITSGGSEAVLFSFLACLNPGDEIIVPEPASSRLVPSSEPSRLPSRRASPCRRSRSSRNSSTKRRVPSLSVIRTTRRATSTRVAK